MTAIEQAIEALEHIAGSAMDITVERGTIKKAADATLTALRGVKEQPVGEIVGFQRVGFRDVPTIYWHAGFVPEERTMLYATPPANAERLSETEIEELFQQAADADEEVHIRFARAIEAETARRLGVALDGGGAP